MKRTSLIIATGILVVASIGGVYAYGKHGHHSPEQKAEFVTKKVSRYLELDAAQKQNFVVLADLVTTIMVEAKANKTEHFAEVETLIAEPNLDQARALGLVQKHTSLIDEKAPEVIASLAIFLDSLNPEQKGELMEFVEHRSKHRGHRNHDSEMN